MKITQLKINHVNAPLGFSLGDVPVISYKVEEAKGIRQTSLVIRVYDEQTMIYDSGVITDARAVYPLPVKLAPRARYRVEVEVESDVDEKAVGETWFETGKMNEPWTAKWIGPEKDAVAVPEVSKDVNISGQVARARLYVGCAGLYAPMINGEKVGGEYLTPYFNDYSSWMQVITHDVTDCLRRGENTVAFTLANGWYKGSFALGRSNNIFGDRLAVLSELHIDYADGSRQVISTDETWTVRDSAYEAAEIYDGAVMDYKKEIKPAAAVVLHDIGYDKLKDRLSLPVRVMEELFVQRVITTPKDEVCLDMGQNMVGLLRVDNSAFAESDFKLTFFEELDSEGNVYTENLRSAKQEFIYRSDGKARLIEPEFTFYGFRYVKVEGIDDVRAEAFTGRVLYSEMAQTGYIETSNPLVNRLFLNALWGQKGNFVDVPTDCPQRDERLGWTGDAQVFSGTAYYNMDVSAFFNKFLYDTRCEQVAADGAVPLTVPSCAAAKDQGMMKSGVAAWGDAATVIPWNNYLHTGDIEALRAHYPIMRDWVEYIRGKDSGNRLWDSGFQLGDWLALDAPNGGSLGLTPESLVASSYYLYSAELTAAAARELDYIEDMEMHTQLAEEIRQAIHREFITPSGRVGSDTQTSDVLALYMDFAVDRERTAAMLKHKITGKYNGHLSTGFVGTAYLCRVLSDNGHNDVAYQLLLNRDYPGWLYEVKKGATTIWERWNSIKPDGSFGDAAMNSFNHYAYGAVMEWVYRNAAGLQPMTEAPGFRKIKYAPQPDMRLEWLKAGYDSACGLYESEWKIEKTSLCFKLRIPFGGGAALFLPDAPKNILLNGTEVLYNAGMELTAGDYDICYTPSRAYYVEYDLDSASKEIISHPELMAALVQVIPSVAQINPVIFKIVNGSIRALLERANIIVTPEAEEKLLNMWRNIRSWYIEC